jgi:hypothetical protein
MSSPTVQEAAEPSEVEAPRPPGQLDAAVMEQTYAFKRAGLGFDRRETELAFRAWHVAVAVPFTRIGMIGSLICWSLVLIVLATAPGAIDRWGLPIALGMLPVCVGSLVITYRPRLLRWMTPATMFANLLAGVLGIFCYHEVFGPELATVGAVVVAFFGFTIFRLRPGQAALCVAPYLALCEVVSTRDFLAGHLERAAWMACSASLLFVFLPGLLACAVLDRGSRRSFRQERINEAQRLAIEEQQRQLSLERARTESILNQEVRRQVAERAKDLSEQLLRVSGLGSPAPRLALGDVLGARYRTVRQLGAGGMGAVYEVERLSDGQRLALKVMSGAVHRAALVRFAREAQVAAQLDHPNVVATHDLGVTEAGALYLVMELVAGTSLEKHAARFGQPAWAVPVLTQVAKALTAMHAQGIIHRDLKPSNVMLQEGLVKVSDFGIASIVGEAAPAVSLTQTGALVGTPLYMAPELALGTRDATAAADIFSFGVLGFQLLAGRLPYLVPPVRELQANRPLTAFEPLQSAVPVAPAALAHLVTACLQPDPRARPSAAEAAASFGDLDVSQLPAVARQPQATTPDTWGDHL